MTADIITKEITLKAPLDRVWSAISEAEEFGQWFGMRFDSPFEAGQTITGRIVPTSVDARIADSQKPYEGLSFSFQIGEIVPKSLFSFSWHPYAIDRSVDYSSEPMTLVVFTLKPIDDSVHLTITESGFDAIPLARRAAAFAANSGGWDAQTRLIEAYLAR